MSGVLIYANQDDLWLLNTVIDPARTSIQGRTFVLLVKE